MLVVAVSKVICHPVYYLATFRETCTHESSKQRMPMDDGAKIALAAFKDRMRQVCVLLGWRC